MELDGDEEVVIEGNVGGDGVANHLQGQQVDESDSEGEEAGDQGIGVTPVEYVSGNVVDDIVNDVQQYSRVDGVESAMRRSQRLRERDEMRVMLTVPVERFVGLGLQMEMHEARRKYGVRAVKAAASEIKQLLKKQVFRGVTVEEQQSKYDAKPIPSSMKIKEKFKGGLLEKLKGRLTAGGHKQCKETFRDIKYAPTVSTTSVMSTACIAAKEDRAVATLDSF